MKHAFLILLTAIAVAGCTKHQTVQYDPALEALALAMDSTEWNSRCPQIEQIDPADLHTKADSALYSLLAYANIKRSGHRTPVDSLIATATDFYADGKEPRRAMMAWYFRACSNWDQGYFAEAVYYALHMQPYAEELADTLYLVRFCDVMASSYERTNNNLEAAQYYDRASKYLHAKPDLESWNNTYFTRQAISSWFSAGYSDSALVIFRENIPLLLGEETDTIQMIRNIGLYRSIVRGTPALDYEQIARDYDAIDAIPLAKYVLESRDFMRLERDYYRAKVRNPQLIGELLPKLAATGIDTFNLQHPFVRRMIPNVVQAQQKYTIEQQTLEAQKNLRRRTRLMLVWGSLGIILLLCIGIWLYRRSLVRKEDELSIRIDEIRSLREEMNLRAAANQAHDERIKTLTDKLFAQRLSEINRLCDNYYNHRDMGEKAKSVFYREFESRLADLGSKQTVAEIEQLVNECKDGLVTKLREELPQLREQDVNFLTYIYAGFAARTICLFLGITKDNYYMRRRRIKARIADSDAPSRQRFLDEMGN